MMHYRKPECPVKNCFGLLFSRLGSHEGSNLHWLFVWAISSKCFNFLSRHTTVGILQAVQDDKPCLFMVLSVHHYWYCCCCCCIIVVVYDCNTRCQICSWSVTAVTLSLVLKFCLVSATWLLYPWCFVWIYDMEFEVKMWYQIVILPVQMNTQ